MGYVEVQGEYKTGATELQRKGTGFGDGLPLPQLPSLARVGRTQGDNVTGVNQGSIRTAGFRALMVGLSAYNSARAWYTKISGAGSVGLLENTD